MRHIPEPCLCGATDCPRCYPHSWQSAGHEDRYLELCEEIAAEDPDLSEDEVGDLATERLDQELADAAEEEAVDRYLERIDRLI